MQGWFAFSPTSNCNRDHALARPPPDHGLGLQGVDDDVSGFTTIARFAHGFGQRKSHVIPTCYYKAYQTNIVFNRSGLRLQRAKSSQQDRSHVTTLSRFISTHRTIFHMALDITSRTLQTSRTTDFILSAEFEIGEYHVEVSGRKRKVNYVLSCGDEEWAVSSVVAGRVLNCAIGLYSSTI